MDDRKLSQCAVYLRNAAPEQWAEFLKEFERLTNEAVLLVTETSDQDMMRVQGWARCARFFLRSFKDPDGRARAKPTAEAPSR